MGKEESITFIKKIKDSNLEIRNLNEFIDESETSELQMSDIDNLINVYSFFEKLMKNDKIKTDEDLLKIFKETFNKEKQIEIKLQNYLNSYGEIIQLFESYGENPEMTIQKIESILKDIKINFPENNELIQNNNKNNNEIQMLKEQNINYKNPNNSYLKNENVKYRNINSQSDNNKINYIQKLNKNSKTKSPK